MMSALFREARPRQWAKNLLVFAAPGAAGVLFHRQPFIEAVTIFVAFCLASAGTYYWNDILDVESDRLHATKRFRPVASGAIPINTARIVGTILLLAGIGLSFTTRWQAGLACLVYIAITTTYSVIWKHIAVVDLIAVAAGFVVRAVAGAEATDVPMSSWFLLVTTFGSLFIVTGKRYAELRELGDGRATSRATLEEYSLGFLRIVLAVSCGATLVAYCIWAFEAPVPGDGSLIYYQLSIVPMLTALLRYLLILEQGHGAAPEEIFIADRTLQVLGLLWVAIFAVGVYV